MQAGANSELLLLKSALSETVAVMSSGPEGAQLAMTAGSQGDGIYYIVKPALNEHTRK